MQIFQSRGKAKPASTARRGLDSRAIRETSIGGACVNYFKMSVVMRLAYFQSG